MPMSVIPILIFVKSTLDITTPKASDQRSYEFTSVTLMATFSKFFSLSIEYKYSLPYLTRDRPITPSLSLQSF